MIIPIPLGCRGGKPLYKVVYSLLFPDNWLPGVLDSAVFSGSHDLWPVPDHSGTPSGRRLIRNSVSLDCCRVVKHTNPG